MSRCSLRFPRCSALVLIVGCLTLAAQAPAPNLNDPATLLAAARATNGLSGDDLKPWHMKADYDLFDDNGKPLGKGVFEEWWVAKDKWKQSYSGSHYSGTIYRSPEGYARTGHRVAWPEFLIADALISPILEKLPSTLQPSKPQILNDTHPPLSCMAISRDASHAPFGNAPCTYCFDVGSAHLRLRTADLITSIYGPAQTFHGRGVATQLQIEINREFIIVLHVGTLTDDDEAGVELRIPETATPFLPEMTPGEGEPPKLIRGDDPKRPLNFRGGVTKGKVALRLIVDEQGRTIEAHTLDASDKDLADAAKRAALTFHYQPAKVRGKPVGSEITFFMNFH